MFSANTDEETKANLEILAFITVEHSTKFALKREEI